MGAAGDGREANGLGDERQRRKHLGYAPMTYRQTVRRQVACPTQAGRNGPDFQGDRRLAAPSAPSGAMEGMEETEGAERKLASKMGSSTSLAAV